MQRAYARDAWIASTVKGPAYSMVFGETVESLFSLVCSELVRLLFWLWMIQVAGP